MPIPSRRLPSPPKITTRGTNLKYGRTTGRSGDNDQGRMRTRRTVFASLVDGIAAPPESTLPAPLCVVMEIVDRAATRIGGIWAKACFQTD
jgi:hypothetical protein